jgi:HK97 family phage prohead protease
METKSVSLELKELSKEKRTAIIAHAVYNDIDRVGDIARKGMFTKSWDESKDDIAFYLNHDDTLAPGKVLDVFEDDKQAYTKAWFGNHTLGNDTLIMLEEGVIKKASFGYIPEKKSFSTIKGRKVRELKEVQHLETSVLTKIPCHPKAGVISVVKSLEFKKLSLTEQQIFKQLAASTQTSLEDLVRFSGTLDPSSDLYTTISYLIERHFSLISEFRWQLKYNAAEIKSLTAHKAVLEKFVRDTKASDECIKTIEHDIEEIKSFLADYDTDGTQLIAEPPSSKNDEAIVLELKTLNSLFKQAK